MADLLQNSPEFNKIMKFKPTSLSWLIVAASVFILFLLFLLTYEVKIPRTVFIPLPKQDVTWLTDHELAFAIPLQDSLSVNQAEKIYLTGGEMRQEVFKEKITPDSTAQLFRLQLRIPSEAKLKKAIKHQSLALECNLPGDSFWKKIVRSIF